MKIQSPWMGRIKGSAGNMTGCKVYDKNVMRAKAFEVNNPKTSAQTTQRDYFAKLSDLVASFSEAQLRALFPNKPKSMSRRNALAQQLSQWFTVNGNDKSIDFANISTLGNASTMDFGEVRHEIVDNSIDVYLSNSVSENVDIMDYRFIAAIVNVTKKDILLTTDSEFVRNQVLSISLPANWEQSDTVHAIPLVTNYKSSEILHGFGSFIIKTRPEKTGREI